MNSDNINLHNYFKNKAYSHNFGLLMWVVFLFLFLSFFNVSNWHIFLLYTLLDVRTFEKCYIYKLVYKLLIRWMVIDKWKSNINYKSR